MPKFFEIVDPKLRFEFIGRRRFFAWISTFLIGASLLALPINYFTRGAILNYSIEFRGGTEMTVAFSAPKEGDAADRLPPDPGNIRRALAAGGFDDAEVVALRGSDRPHSYILRFGAISAVSDKEAKKLEAAFTETFAEGLRKFEFSEGGDKIFLRFSKAVEIDKIAEIFKAQDVAYTDLKTFGRREDNAFEVVLISVGPKVRKTLEKTLGEGSVAAILGSDSVGAKAGSELRDDGIKSLFATIIFILIYIAVRFDFRYGPGTVAALLHDSLMVVGAFAVTYREFSLTTVAAILTVIGYSMNDTIVVFDRIRENAARMRDKKFDRIVNASINETLSRTLLTSLTLFMVTLFMNIIGTGTVREFAFAMNVGVIVGTYSSIFVASPVLIWLNERFQTATPRRRTKGRK